MADEGGADRRRSAERCSSLGSQLDPEPKADEGGPKASSSPRGPPDRRPRLPGTPPVRTQLGPASPGRNYEVQGGGVELLAVKRGDRQSAPCPLEDRGAPADLGAARVSHTPTKARPRKNDSRTTFDSGVTTSEASSEYGEKNDGSSTSSTSLTSSESSESSARSALPKRRPPHKAARSLNWWRCSGPCRRRRPSFGLVKRSGNRPPSERDHWWADHKRSCGGTFTRIQEPRNRAVKKPTIGGSPCMAARAPTKTAAVAPLGHVSGQATLWEDVPPREIQTTVKSKKLLRNIHTFSRPSAKRQIPAVIALANRARALAGGPVKLGCEEKTAGLFGTRNSPSPRPPARHKSEDEAAVGCTTSGQKGETASRKPPESVRPPRPPPKKFPKRNFPRLIGLKGGTTSLQRVEETVSSGTGTDESEESASTSSLSSDHMPNEGTSRGTARGASSQVGYVSCCPVCGVYMEIQVIDPHLDTCLLRFD